MAKFEVEDGRYGKKIIVKSEWSKEITDYCLLHNIQEVYLNIAHGWRGKDIYFLKDVPNIVALKILTDYASNLSSLYYLTNLKWLSLDVIVTEIIDFKRFQYLEEAYIDWSEKVRSIIDCKLLKKICIAKYRSKKGDLSELSKLTNLETLQLIEPNITGLGNMSHFKKLIILEISLAKKIVSLSGIDVLAELKRLVINTCRKISNINPIEQLKKLEFLDLSNDGNIQSLKPIADLNLLREVYFVESTNILDGDLTFIKNLPNLKKISFQNRRHYNLRREDFSQWHK